MSFVQIQSMTLTPNWNYGGSVAYLRIFASQPFYEFSTGQFIAQGSPTDINSFCQEYTCTVVGTAVTLPDITLATTIDSSVPTAVYTAIVYDENNNQRYVMLSEFFVDPEYFQSPTQSSVTVDTAGSSIVNGNYTYRGQFANRPYYNLEGQADSTSLYAIFWDGAQWNLTNSAGSTFYTAPDSDFPWEEAWSVDAGSSPAPNVNQNQELVVATWEQLTISNQGSATVWPWMAPGPFWNVEQVKQYVNSLVGDGTTPFANEMIVGKTALDADPEVSTFPQAVAVNSPRLTKVLSVDYNNNLATALTDIGSTPTTLIIKEDANVTAPRVIPATLFLEFQNDARLVKTATGTLTFQGANSFNAASTTALFENFSAGNVTFSGDYPRSVSTEIFDTGNTSLSQRVARCDAMFSAKAPQLVCYPRVITAFTQIDNFYNVHFTPGEYTNTRNDNQFRAAFEIASNTWVTGDNATLYESSSNLMGAMFAPSDSDTLSAFENIFVIGLRFKGVGTTGNITSTVILGNCNVGGIINCIFDETHHYNLLGGIGTDGNYGQNLTIAGCTFINVNTQSCAVVNCINARIVNNSFYMPDVDATYSPIDVEPNVDTDRVENCVIEGNTFYLPNNNAFAGVVFVIAVQAALDGSIKNVIIRNNSIIGASAIPAPVNLSPVASGISMYGVSNYQIYDNYIQSAYQTGAITVEASRYGQIYNNVGFQNSHSNSLYCLGLYGVADTDIHDNVFNESNYPGAAGNQPTNIYESEWDYTVTTSGTTISNTVFDPGEPNIFRRFYDLSVGLNVLINTAVYTIDSYVDQGEMETSSAMPTMTRLTFTSADVTIGTGNIAIAGHGYLTGGALYLTGTDVPGNLTSDRVYYAIRVDANNLKLADTLALALATTPITFSDAGTGTNKITPVMRTQFSSNRYWDNKAPDGITLESTGTSRIWGDAERVIGDWVTPAQITSNQNNYNPGVNAYRLDLSTDASRNITGLALTSPPQLNGEKHEIYNAGANPIVLVNQSASSTSANRFLTTTGADITLAPDEIAYLEYNGSFWIVWSSAISAGQLPSSIPATKIGAGTVDNTEFGYLNGVTSSLQTQIDAKAPSNSPTLVTPNLGTPTAGVLTACTVATASAGDNDTSIASTAFVQGGGVGALYWTALISQSGTSNPTATVKNNTLGGTVVLARTGLGVYTLTLAGAFPSATRTFFGLAWNNVGGGSGVVSVNPVWTSANVVTITTWDRDNVAIDLDTNSPISLTITVYPT